MFFRFNVSGWLNTQYVEAATEQQAYEEAIRVAAGQDNLYSFCLIEAEELEEAMSESFGGCLHSVKFDAAKLVETLANWSGHDIQVVSVQFRRLRLPNGRIVLVEIYPSRTNSPSVQVCKTWHVSQLSEMDAEELEFEFGTLDRAEAAKRASKAWQEALTQANALPILETSMFMSTAEWDKHYAGTAWDKHVPAYLD